MEDSSPTQKKLEVFNLFSNSHDIWLVTNQLDRTEYEDILKFAKNAPLYPQNNGPRKKSAMKTTIRNELDFDFDHLAEEQNVEILTKSDFIKKT